MARGYRSRRYRAVRRSARRFKKSSSLRKIKKDILKCNFPTKVKFMGLPEKKVMFLTKDITATFTDGNQSHAFILDPMATDNISSILSNKIIYNYDVGREEKTVTAAFSNWDKLCILGIYIKFQPKKNVWTANAADEIVPVKCTYTTNNCPLKATINGVSVDVATKYDKENVKNKQVFTFNSNDQLQLQCILNHQLFIRVKHGGQLLIYNRQRNKICLQQEWKKMEM